MTVKDMVAAKLRELGADGLCNVDCGCGAENDLFLCEEGPFPNCETAIFRLCDDPENDGYGNEIYMPMELSEPQDIRAIAGTWPGKPDDGFEEAIDELRYGKKEEPE